LLNSISSSFRELGPKRIGIMTLTFRGHVKSRTQHCSIPVSTIVSYSRLKMPHYYYLVSRTRSFFADQNLSLLHCESGTVCHLMRRTEVIKPVIWRVQAFT